MQADKENLLRSPSNPTEEYELSLVSYCSLGSYVHLLLQVWLLGDKLIHQQPIETELLQFVTDAAAQGHIGSDIFDQISTGCLNQL